MLIKEDSVERVCGLQSHVTSFNDNVIRRNYLQCVRTAVQKMLQREADHESK